MKSFNSMSLALWQNVGVVQTDCSLKKLFATQNTLNLC